MEKRQDDVALDAFIQNFADVMQGVKGLFLFVWELPAYRYHVWPVRHAYAVSDGQQYDIEEYLDKVIYTQDREFVGECFHTMLAGREHAMNFSCRIVDVGGKHRWANFHLQNSLDEKGAVRLMGGYVTSIEELRRQDPLTGLFTDAQCAIDYEEGMPGETGYLLRLDIDDMSFVNELHGREFGDTILKQIAQILQGQLYKECRCYRAEDDVFTIVMPGADKARAAELYNTVSNQVAEFSRGLEQDWRITLSSGATTWPSDSGSFETLNRYAAGAMNTAKLAGKNTQVFFQLEEYEKYQNELGMRADISRCVHNGLEGFSLHYQPQVSLKSGRVVSAEALLRWQSKEHGVVSPFRFVPVLEKTGLILEVGRWVLDQALAQCAVWRQREPDFVMGVNVAYHQLVNDDMVGAVRQTLEKYGLPGSCLVLELTESEQLRNFGYFNRQLEPLHDMGVSVAIDDFGTGYSSLGYFKELHINQVKIDRCFVTRIRESEYDYRLIEFITGLAHSTKMEVCVEGVETAEELRALMPLEPDLIQGYYFGRPVPEDVFTREILANPQMMDWETLKEAQRLAGEGRVMSPATLSVEEEFKSIMDSLPEVVHLTEIESGRLIYMNKTGRLAYGVKNYEGKACFEVIHGREEPCEGCWSMQLKRDEFASWRVANERFGGEFDNMVKMIPWQGRMVRLGITIIAKDAPAAEADGVDKLLVSCMRGVLSAPTVQRGMETAIWYLKNWYSPDRVHIYGFDELGGDATRIFSRSNDKVDPQRDILRVMARADFPGWLDELAENRVVMAYNKESVAQHFPFVYESLRGLGLQYPVLLVPFGKGGSVTGFVKIDNPTRHMDQPMFATDVGVLLADGIQKLELAENPFSNAMGLW